jgi:hypothetical protein
MATTTLGLDGSRLPAIATGVVVLIIGVLLLIRGGPPI